jgi:tetratricopeptide (TPR) repeat protein
VVAPLVSRTCLESQNDQTAAMSLVTHKYTPAEMSDEELESTFAAREHTVDYLIKALRDQMGCRTLSSYVITGPRGAGKSTIIQMVDLRIRQDPELSAAWISIIFPEEQFDITSLRDMLAATLRALAKQNAPAAQAWSDKVEAEPDEEQSEQLAITGIREITRQTGKRLILFVENLDHLLQGNLNDKMKGTLRRLLMSDALMMIIGSTVHIFEALKSYDEAFFNYFGQVPLGRLNAEQVSELLRKRAEYDGNDRFLRELPKQQAKVKTLVHLTGGNPRFVLMLYELLSLQQVTTIVQQLKRLVDELTPLLKDEMENLPPQQRKIIHALMERGGTAQPTDLTGPTRLPLNAVTTQLKRLKDAQLVEVLGGGKGRAANYTVPDKLFSLWYQMRYLSQNRRRIELFVEVLRVWFEADERIDTLRKLACERPGNTAYVLRERATTAEYLAASLKDSPHALAATEICISHWITTDLKEAAMAYADLSSEAPIAEHAAHLGLSDWLANHGDFGKAIKALDEAIAKSSCSPKERSRALFNRGVAKGKLGDNQGAIVDYTAVVQSKGTPQELVASALVNRGVVKGELGDREGARADYTAVIQLKGAHMETIEMALLNRGIDKGKLGDTEGEIADYTAVINLSGVSRNHLAAALIYRGITKKYLGDTQGAITDYTAVINLEGAPKAQVAMALVRRGNAKVRLGDIPGAIADYTGAINLDGAPKEQVATALLNRAKGKGRLGDIPGAIADCTAVIDLRGAPKEQLAAAFFGRAILSSGPGKLTQAAFDDLMRVISFEITTNDLMSDAAALAIVAGQVPNSKTGTEEVLLRFSTTLDSLSNAQARQAALALLNALAMPEMRETWPVVWHSLVARLKQQVVEAIRFLEPVCRILEGQDRSLLDALPPEQREFALEVMAKFEPKTETTAAEPKEAERKRTRGKAKDTRRSHRK